MKPFTWGSQYKFLGNEDDGGLMAFGARFYDPLVGRFTSPDPIRVIGSSNTINPYVYCMNNPMRYTDKFGLRAAQAPILRGGDEISGGGGGGSGSGYWAREEYYGGKAFTVIRYGEIPGFTDVTALSVYAARQIIKDFMFTVNKYSNTIFINYLFKPNEEEQEAFESQLTEYTTDKNIVHVTARPQGMVDGQVYLEVWGNEQCRQDTTGIGAILGEGTKTEGWTTLDFTCYINFEKIRGNLNDYIGELKSSGNLLDALHYEKTGIFNDTVGRIAAFTACHEFAHVIFGVRDDVHGTGVTPFLQTWKWEGDEGTTMTPDIINYLKHPNTLIKLNPGGYSAFQRYFNHQPPE